MIHLGRWWPFVFRTGDNRRHRVGPVVRNLVIKVCLVGLIAKMVSSLLVWRKESVFCYFQ